jgi:VanZ family protein
VKEHVDGRMGLWQRWIGELRGAFNAKWLAVAVAATLGVLGLTHIPQDAIPRVLTADRFDKVEHVIAYGIMAALYLFALNRESVDSLKQADEGKRRRWEVKGWLGVAVLIILGLAALGGVDESTQPYVNRTCDFWDWVGDVTGIVGISAFFVTKWAVLDPKRVLATAGRKGKSR